VKKILIAAGMTCAALSPALAADPYIEIPQELAPAYSWTGGYIGLQAGYGWGQVDRLTIAGFANSYDANGFLVGAHGGFNQQWGSFVLGIEGDIEWSDMNGDDAGVGGTLDVVDIEWMASVRARAGFAINRTLIYATGGVAFADITQSNIDGIPISFSETYTGWTAGAGLEYAFTDNFTGRVEYRYTDFGSQDYLPVGIDPFSDDITMHAVRIGMTYKF